MNILKAATFCCVDVYALISGYVGASGKWKPSKLLYFEAEVLFYTLLITYLFSLRFPETVNETTWLNAYHPITTSQYWYMTAYFGVLLLSPILGAGVKNAEKQYAFPFLLLVLILVCFCPIFFKSGAYNLNNGYSLIWLALLFCVGGMLKRSAVFEKAPFFVGLLLYAVAVTGAYHLFKSGKTDYVGFRSPLILLAAVGLLQAFSKIKIRTRPAQFLCKWFGEATLGVYLIHVHPLIWAKYIKNYSVKYHLLENAGPWKLCGNVLLAAFVLFLSCLLIDSIRMLLFRLLFLKKGFGLLDKLWNLICRESKPNET